MRSLSSIACLMLLLIVASLAPGEEQTLDSRLAPLIAAHQGDVAVAVKHLPTGESFTHQADMPMPTASLIKLPIMVEAYRQAGEGKLDLKQSMTLNEEDKTPGSGILTTHFSAGASFPLRDAIRLMIAYSDNTATNLVLTKTGLGVTNETMEKLGLANTKIHAFVFRPNTSIAPERSKEFGLGSTTASEMIALLERLHRGELVSPDASREMLGHLRQCQDDRIPRLLPAGTTVAHKTGSVAKDRTAAGLIEAPGGPIALCVLTSNNHDQRWSDDNAAQLLTAKIARAVYDHFEAGRPAAAIDEGVLKRGATGRMVELLQHTLNARLDPSPNLTVDGDFGPLTEAALKAFQLSRQLPESGETDEQTRAALNPVVEAK